MSFVCFQTPPTQFSEDNWPLHVTLLDPFKTIWSPEELIRKVGELASKTKSFEMHLSQRSFLGPNKDVPVMLVKIDKRMRQHHNDLLNLGVRGSFVYNTPEFVGDGFVPHITDAHDERAELDKFYAVKTVSIVDTIPDGDLSRRRIIKTFNLALS